MNCSGGSRRVISLVKPGAVRTREYVGGLVPMPLVRVDAAHDDVVAQHHLRCCVGRGRRGRCPPAPDSCQTHDAAAATARTHWRSPAMARTFDDHVRLESQARRPTRVIRRSEGAYELRLAPVRRGRARAPRARAAGRSCRPAARSVPRRSRARCAAPRTPAIRRSDLLPCLGDDGRGLEQYSEQSEPRSTFMTYSGSTRHRSDMKPSISLMPRSV